MQDIHDIHPPVMVGMDPAVVTGLIWAGAVVFCAAMAALVWWVWKRQRRVKQREAPPQPSAMEQALIDLTDLERRRSGMTPKQVYFELAALFKGYIGRAYACHAGEMTTRELAQALASSAMHRSLADRVIRFHATADPFRYASDMPEPDRMTADLITARELIQAMETDRNAADTPSEHPADSAPDNKAMLRLPAPGSKDACEQPATHDGAIHHHTDGGGG